MNCEECKKRLKCCGGWLYSLIPFLQIKEIKEVDGKLDIPAEFTKISVEGIPLKRISRFEWICEWFKNGRCEHHELRSDFCKGFFCKENDKGLKKKRYLNSVYGLKCPE